MNNKSVGIDGRQYEKVIFVDQESMKSEINVLKDELIDKFGDSIQIVETVPSNARKGQLFFIRK